MRKAINFLQNLKYLHKNISIDDIYTVTCSIKNDVVSQHLRLCKNIQFDSMIQSLNELWKHGYDLYNLLEVLATEIINNSILCLPDGKINLILYHLLQCNRILFNGADEQIQLYNMFAYVYGIANDELKGFEQKYDFI